MFHIIRWYFQPAFGVDGAIVICQRQWSPGLELLGQCRFLLDLGKRYTLGHHQTQTDLTANLPGLQELISLFLYTPIGLGSFVFCSA